MQSDLVSVIIPCYNQGQYLAQALDSIAAQTYPYWECIIVNDGSTDETEDVALSYTMTDQRFTYFKQINSGVSATRNAGLKQAKGNYIKFLDADDWIDNQMLEKSMKSGTQYDLVITNTKNYFEDKKELRDYYCDLSKVDLSYQNILMNFAVNFDIPIHCGLITSKLLHGFQFNTSLALREDWVMWLHIFKQQPAVLLINEPLAFYRKWHSSATANLNKTLINEFYAYQYVIAHFAVDSVTAKTLQDRTMKKMMDKVEFLEQSNIFLRNSTSFKIGNFFVCCLTALRKPFTLKNK